MGQGYAIGIGVSVIFFLLIIFMTLFIAVPRTSFMHATMLDHMDMDEKREMFVSLSSSIQDELLPQVKYRCCLEKPCRFCIERNNLSNGDAACDCIKNIMEGKAPCQECIGGILEGKGNKYMAAYFASAIAEEVGEDHLPALKQIISEKYVIPVEDQL